MRNLNLLPRDRIVSLKREVVLGSTNQFLSTVMWGVASMTFVGLMALAIMWSVSYVDSKSAEAELTQQVSRYQQLRSDIGEDNKFLKSIDDVSIDRIVWSDLLMDLLQILHADVKIDEINIDSNSGIISFSGQASVRSSLVVLENRLNELPWVTEVEAPSENLLRRYNPHYTITLIIDSEALNEESDEN